MSAFERNIDLMIGQDGNVRMIYNEALDGFALGQMEIKRASHVEPDSDGYWFADLSPIGGPRIGPCLHRSWALALEEDWLNQNWLASPIRSS